MARSARPRRRAPHRRRPSGEAAGRGTAPCAGYRGSRPDHRDRSCTRRRPRHAARRTSRPSPRKGAAPRGPAGSTAARRQQAREPAVIAGGLRVDPEQHGTQPVPEPGQGLGEPRNGFCRGAVEGPDAGTALSLHDEPELGRRRGDPGRDLVGGRPRVERVVELHGGQTRRVVGEEVARRERRWVEPRRPVRVREAARPGVEMARRAGRPGCQAPGSVHDASAVASRPSSSRTPEQPRSIAARSRSPMGSRK